MRTQLLIRNNQMSTINEQQTIDSSQLVLSRRPMAAITNNLPIRNIPTGITFEEVLDLRDQAKHAPSQHINTIENRAK